MLTRHSSRRQPLDAAFLTARLTGAKSYDRIAGYFFSSSILEIAGEALETVQGKIRVVCNSQLSRADVDVAKLAQAAMRREWCEAHPEALGENARPRFQRLYDFLRSGKLEVRVLPDDVFGLIHGTISPRAKSLLLATATPVQLHPVEAYDLLDALAEGSPAVLGVPGSPWRDPAKSLPVLLGRAEATTDFHERWDWLRNPFPPAEEGRDFEILRRSLELDDAQAYAPGNAVESLRPADRDRVSDVFPRFLESHNPYIRAIVLRTREYLENSGPRNWRTTPRPRGRSPAWGRR